MIMFECKGLTEGLRKIFYSGARRADLFVLNRDYSLFDRDGPPLARY